MKTYESMKASNVLWLGDIPKHWELRFLEQTCHEKSVKNIGNIESNVLSLSYGYIIKKKNVYSGLVANDFSTYQIVQNGDIILRFTDLQNDHKSLRTGLVTQTGIITSAYTCITPTINSAYLRYLLHSYDLRKVFYGMGGGVRQSIGFKDVRHMFVPVPPRDEQDQIVRFLDWKVSEINRLINVQKKFISIVEEQKEKIICDALLHGINTDVSYKNTGISWLSSIPSHWKVIKIKWLFDEADERNTDKNAELLTFSKKKGLIPFSEASDKLPSANDLSNYKIIHKGQLLENRMQAWHGMFICADKEGCVSPDYSAFSASKERELNVKFYEYVFRCHIWVEQFANASRGVGSGFNRLYTPQFGAIYTIYPEVSEQNRIVAYLDEQMQKIEAAIANKQKQIETLQELKTRLISDVVTGKIDVRGVEIPDYEYVEEESDESLNSEEEPEDYKENN